MVREETGNYCSIWPNNRTAHPVAPKISVGWDMQNSMVRLQLQLSAINGRQTNCLLHRAQSTPSCTGSAQSRISTNVFFKITKFSAYRFRVWRYSNPSPISYLEFLLWQLWLLYPLRASVNCTQCMCTRTKCRIVQSPTKPNDKI